MLAQMLGMNPDDITKMTEALHEIDVDAIARMPATLDAILQVEKDTLTVLTALHEALQALTEAVRHQVIDSIERGGGE